MGVSIDSTIKFAQDNIKQLCLEYEANKDIIEGSARYDLIEMVKQYSGQTVGAKRLADLHIALAAIRHVNGVLDDILTNAE